MRAAAPNCAKDDFRTAGKLAALGGEFMIDWLSGPARERRKRLRVRDGGRGCDCRGWCANEERCGGASAEEKGANVQNGEWQLEREGARQSIYVGSHLNLRLPGPR